MIEFLIKSTIFLAALFALYFMFLEKEKMHQFNRFYLLFSLVFSMLIPFVSFEIYVETIQTIQESTIQAMPFSAVEVEEKTNYMPLLLGIIYGLVTLVLISRFVVHLIKIQQKINHNHKEKIQNVTLILLNEKVVPHTFLQYIFINKEDYANHKIEDELFTHELTHVRQRHTIDILFIEFLKTIFWFNPLFVFYKKAIQLNHEFLADEKVVKSYNNVPFYQNLLLEKASWSNNFYLASNLNFLVTKKRLIMMTKTTSQSRALLKKLAVVPILTVLIFISCSENNEDKIKIEKEILKHSEDLIFNAVDIRPDFPGGIQKFYEFVGENFKMPEVKDLKGKVFIQFTVETDGSIADVEVLRDIGHGTGEEAVRVMKLSPKWIPGENNGKPVRVKYSLPISIRSSE